MALAFCALASHFHEWVWIFPATVTLGLSVVKLPAIDSTVAESVETHERSVAYSVVHFFTLLQGIFTSAIGGFIAYKSGYTAVFLMGILLQVLCLALLLRFMGETLLVLREIDWSELVGFLKTFLSPMRKLRGFYLITALDGAFWGVSGVILYGTLVKTYNLSILQVGIMQSIALVSNMCSLLPMGILIQRYGCKGFMMLTWVFVISMFTGLLTFTSFEAIAALQILEGLILSAWMLSIKTFLSNRVLERSRAEAFGKLSSFKALIRFPAPYIGGILYDNWGFTAPITTGLVGAILTLAAIFMVIREQ